MNSLAAEPYRLLMPVGVLVLWLGAGHWLLFAAGVLAEYRPVFHALAMVQGFLAAFAAGFLLTMIPRRLQAPPPATWQVWLVAVAAVGAALFAWPRMLAASQLCWIALLLVLGEFVVRRMRTGNRRAPTGFVWIPIAFGFGVVGSVLASAGGMLGPAYWWLHQIGRGLSLQGTFVALVLGVGVLALPVMTRGQGPPDAPRTVRGGLELALHLVAATVLAASFVVEHLLSGTWGFLLRAAVALLGLLIGARIYRPPNKPGTNRWLIWLSAWALPVGYVLAAAAADRWRAGLHVVFISGFTLLALAIGVQVALGHGGFERLKSGRPLPVWLLGACVIGATAARAAMDFDSQHMTRWMAVAAGAIVTAGAIWMAWIGPKLLPRQGPDPI